VKNAVKKVITSKFFRFGSAGSNIFRLRLN